jgi:MFS family permease
MDNLFILQLTLSFLVGGGFIAFLSLIAEKVNRKISGIILGSPSTVLLGFFFLGWATSPETVADIIPSTLIPMGISSLFATSYAYLSEYLQKYIKKRKKQIILTFILSISIWFLVAVPIVILKINNLFFGIIGYFIIIFICHLLLRKKSHEKPPALTYTFNQKLGRATFVGFIVFLVVFLGKTLNPFWGGIFTMFPAAFSSTLILIHYYYGSKMIFPTFQKIPFGSISLFIYTISVMITFPIFGFILGTFISYIASLIFILILISKNTQNLINRL